MKKVKSNSEIYMGIRRDWGNVNPVTRVIPNKKKNPKIKHKKRDYEEQSRN